jgi:hypothetical protein
MTTLMGVKEDDAVSFLPVDTHDGYTLGWPLGATLHAALGLGSKTD